MDDELHHQELVKCVLVGDNAVGKTRLIVARACHQKVSLGMLLNTHVPTVWAIDQYRIYKEVLENSWMVLDGVNVSLRLWDTFGDHHKDRRFAYGRSDVVLMCFDIGRLISLENCRLMWYSQIRKFCPTTPIILVGCKNDFRYIYQDEQYLNYCKEKGPLVRQVTEKDIIFPEQGRCVARELGIPYYETSVLSYSGVHEVFENSIRAALGFRRAQRFWMTNLRRVLSPKPQEPHCPPKPKLPLISSSHLYPSSLTQDLQKCLLAQKCTDVIFLCENVGFSSHRFILSASSPYLYQLFVSELNSKSSKSEGDRSSSELSLNSGNESSLSFEDDETMSLLPHQSSSSSFSSHECADLPELRPGVFIPLNHPALASLKISICESLTSTGRVFKSIQTLLLTTKLLSPPIMSQVLHFIYTGRLREPRDVRFEDLKIAAEFLNIPDLYHFSHTELLKSSEVETTWHFSHSLREMENLGLINKFFSDISFQLDDGILRAHKALLMARCEMMEAMFSHEDFIERSSSLIKFPGVTKLSFEELLHYLYTDRASEKMAANNCLGALELGNRLCLPRFISLIEEIVIRKMTGILETGEDVTLEALRLLEHSQIHNAEQLSDWCLAYLSQNYSFICQKYSKILRSLHPENQAYLNVHRWPPNWYLKEIEFYQKMKLEDEREELSGIRSVKRRRQKKDSGCLWFVSNGSKD